MADYPTPGPTEFTADQEQAMRKARAAAYPAFRDEQITDFKNAPGGSQPPRDYSADPWNKPFGPDGR